MMGTRRRQIRDMYASLGTPGGLMFAAIVLGSAVIFSAIAKPIWANHLYVVDDLVNFTIPTRLLYATGLHAGRIDVWSPALFNGFYAHADGQTGMFHPLHLLLYRFVPFTQALGSEILLNYVVLWAGSVLLFYKWTQDWVAAAFGAVVFTFAGSLTPSIVHVNKITVVAHIPWALLALDYCLRGERPRARFAYAALALINGSSILFGYPYFFLLSLVLQVWYAAYLLLEKAPVRRALRSACAIAVGFALGAVQLLPTWNLLQNSNRAQRTFTYLSTGSLDTINFLQWASPYYFHGRAFSFFSAQETSIYVGIGPLLLFIWLCTRNSGEKQRLRNFLLALALVGLFLSLGQHNVLFRYYAYAPVLNLFRMPCRYSLLSIFAIAGGSALALKQLRIASGRLRSSSAFKIVVACLLSLSALTFVSKVTRLPILSRYDAFTNAAPHVLVGVAIIFAGVGFFFGAMRYRGWWLAAFCMFAIADISMYAVTYLHDLPIDKIDATVLPKPPVPPPAALAINTIASDDSFATQGYYVVNAYAGLEPPFVHSMRDPEYLRALGVSASIDDSQKWTLLTTSPAPPVRFEQPFYSQDPIEAMNHGLDLTRIAVVTKPVEVDPSAVGSVQITETHPGFVRITADSSGRMLGVLVQRFYPGWIAESNGKTLDLLPVDGNLTGFVVPGGHQEITLRFHPKNLAWGLAISCTTFVLLMLAILIQVWAYRNILPAKDDLAVLTRT
jgi:hypothetical protein